MQQQTFKVQNVKCGGCANTLMTKLSSRFGNVAVNLEVMPREITLQIANEKVPQLREALKSLGYPMADEDLSFFQNTRAQAKSFVSCAVGKFEVEKEK